MYLYIYISISIACILLIQKDTKKVQYCFTNHTKQKGTKVPENYMTKNTKKTTRVPIF